MEYRTKVVFKREEILNKIKPKKKYKNVLDIGSAPGGWSQFIKKKYPNTNVYALDILDIANDKEIIVKIVGNLESDPDKGEIAIDTPSAKGLVGKFVEDEITIETPSGKLNDESLDGKHI